MGVPTDEEVMTGIYRVIQGDLDRIFGPEILTIDDFLVDPARYREIVLKNTFNRFDFGHIAFDGMALAPIDSGMARKISEWFPSLSPQLSVFRKSPRDQKEPNFIHCDAELGDWTAVLYLNPDPDPRDGTDFWKDLATGRIRGSAEEAVQLRDPTLCEKWRHASAKFNRLLMFPADLFHSRAIYENYGEGDDARLIQVTFGTGSLE